MAPRRPRAPAPSRLLPSLLLLLLVQPPPLLAGGTLALLDYGEDLCNLETPYPRARCVLQPPDSQSCQLFYLDVDNNFPVKPNCIGNKTFIENEDFIHRFDHSDNTTELTIWNRKESHLLLVTMDPYEVWWRLLLPTGEHNVTITGLPGRLKLSSPILLPADCDVLPPLHVKFAAFPKLHTFHVLVALSEEILSDMEINVTIYLISSNETIRSEMNCWSLMEPTSIVSGYINEVITFSDVYSTEHCFAVDIRSENQFTCGIIKNMTDFPYQPFEALTEIPTWWIVVLLLVVVALASGILVLFAYQKGLLRTQCEGVRRGGGGGGGGVRSPLREGEEGPFLEAERSRDGAANGSIPPHHKIIFVNGRCSVFFESDDDDTDCTTWI